VLPNHYNSVLSEEGKLLNPDDATGAALEAALAEVAARKSVKGKLAPDQWELRRWAWAEYDPAFYHISLRGHQSAAENRPLAVSDQPSGERKKRTEPNPYAPRPAAAHASFERLRRDMTSDASVLAITYRILHVHCRHAKSNKDKTSLRGAVSLSFAHFNYLPTIMYILHQAVKTHRIVRLFIPNQCIRIFSLRMKGGQ
jgi:hypothetical protein